MQCGQCNTTNDPERKFCKSCGVGLKTKCPACKFTNDVGDSFCGGCGTSLAPYPTTNTATNDPEVYLEQNLRTVTVWFCDLAGFTKLSEAHGAETIHSLLNQFYEGVDNIVHSFGGTIDKHIGDNVMALFGAPIAHENDPERAVCAALSVHDWMQNLSAMQEIKVKAHIGIAAGRVVAGDTGSTHHQSYTVIGESVNLAARLESLAKAGETVISHEIRTEIRNTVPMTPMGPQDIRGLSETVDTWRVVAETKYNPFDNSTEGVFVGRKRELQKFQTALHAIQSSDHGNIFYIRGQAGMGKSRLLEKFIALGKQQGFNCHTARNLNFGMGNNRSILKLFLSNLIGFGLNEPEFKQHDSILKFASKHIEEQRDSAVLFDIFEMEQPIENRVLLDAMSPLSRHNEKIEFASRTLRRLSLKTPQICGFEDLHFADKTAVSLLQNLLQEANHSRIILVISSRYDTETVTENFWTQAEQNEYSYLLDLPPFTFEEAHEVSRGVLQNEPALLKQCIERAEGNPLFLDQLLRNATNHDNSDTLPGSIESMLIASVDRLPLAERRSLKAASIYGQWFTLDMVNHITGAPDSLFSAALTGQVLRSENGGFIFTHSLMQEAIYNSHLSKQKKALHIRAAEWYDGKDSMLIAQHLDRGESPNAASSYLEAARDCEERFQFTRGLPLIERGLDLSKDAIQKFHLTCLQASMTRETGKAEQARELYETALTMIEDEALQCLAFLGMASCNRWMGRGEESAQILEQTENTARSNREHNLLSQVGYYRGSYLFTKNELDNAITSYGDGLANAEKCGNKTWIARNLSGLADCYYANLQMSKALSYFLECINISHEEGLGRIEVPNRYMTGLTRRYLNEMKAGLDDILSAQKLARDVGHHRCEMYSTNFVAEFLLDMGDVDAALSASNRALELTFMTQNERFRAYVMNQQARGLMELGNKAEALKVLEKAVQISRKVGMSFVGPRLLGTLALCTEEEKIHSAALKEGFNILNTGCHAHNQLWFLRDAIESCLRTNQTAKALKYADHMETITTGEPLAWAKYFIERARAIVHSKTNPKDPTNEKEFVRLEQIAKNAGFSQATVH